MCRISSIQCHTHSMSMSTCPPPPPLLSPLSTFLSVCKLLMECHVPRLTYFCTHTSHRRVFFSVYVILLPSLVNQSNPCLKFNPPLYNTPPFPPSLLLFLIVIFTDVRTSACCFFLLHSTVLPEYSTVLLLVVYQVLCIPSCVCVCVELSLFSFEFKHLFLSRNVKKPSPHSYCTGLVVSNFLFLYSLHVWLLEHWKFALFVFDTIHYSSRRECLLF